jgi:hypothetical protein
MTPGYFRCPDCGQIYDASNWMCPSCLAKYKELLKKETNSLEKNYKNNNI